MNSAPKLPWARAVYLGFAFAVVVAASIAILCTVIGLAGYFLVESGVLTFEEITTPAAIVNVIVIYGILLSILVCFAINHSLVGPLRRMTYAMGRLAEGDFGYRIRWAGKHSIREVAEFAESFNIAARELESTEMMRAGFISDFSHEFRTPINSLSGFAQLLMDDDLTAGERREYAGIIVEEAQRLSGLSERILLLSKVESAEILPNAEPVNVSEQLRRAASLLSAKARERGVEIDLRLDEAQLVGNADYLSQLWVNVLDNAVKFSPDGGSVSVALYGGRVDAAEGAPAGADGDGEVVAWISDEGCGMDSQTQAHIFDRFYQGDSSHSSKGSGLGLSLCKRIVELHGGTIEVQSAPGKGSTFEVRLPRSAASRKAGL